MILAEAPEDRDVALAKLLVFQREDFSGILEAMAGYPVTVRLLDPPLHEFLPPSLEDLVAETTELRCMKGEASPEYRVKMKMLARVRQLHEVNPMLGLRMCRLGIVQPEIYAMQVRALFEAACKLRKRGVDAKPDVMIPGVGTGSEMRITFDAAKAVADAVIEEQGVPVAYRIGTMIELPRACVVADTLAETAQFFSFGTNDLTQTTFGYSRDDADTTFTPTYISKKILTESPFQVLDRVGVGELMRMGIAKGRGTRPELKIGICGEHGGDPASVIFCDELGLDYVSCFPYRVPIARLAAAQSAWRQDDAG
jgi:pyruvate,orthophosphate dikinase